MASQPKNIGHQRERTKPENPDDDQYTEEETARRRDQVIRQMIRTPPKPRSAPAGKAKERPASKGRVHKGKTRT
jgi:hypothetical protein